MEIKTVFFDLDDTLYSDFQACNRAGFEAAGQYAAQTLGLDAAAFVQALTAARRTLYDRLHGEPESHDRVLYAKLALEAMGVNPIRHAETIHRIYWDTVLDRMQLRAGVHDLLDALHARGVTVGVCTNMLADIQMRKLCLLGLADKIDLLITSEEAGADKPELPIFQLALARAGCTADQAIMVGDSFQHDVLGAHAAGMRSVWLHVGTDVAVDTPGLRCYEAANFPQAARWILDQL